ncbi:MAG: ribosomal-protein-alanine N-acetyltransferase [Gammaproteobacteria bacterium]
MSSAVDLPAPFLRPMREHDLARVSIIEQRAYGFPWSIGVFADCLRVGYCCWTIWAENDLAGYGIMSVAAQECHILNVCVDPMHRRRGNAAKLLDQLLESAGTHEARTAYLEVRPSNLGAIDLYTKNGFSQIGRRPAYYPAIDGREDALVLSKEIGG